MNITPIKYYTDLSQSKKLAEILPIESADMSWVSNGLGKPFARTIQIKGDPEELCACWSLAALLNVLPFHLIVNNQRYAFMMHKCLDKDGETYIFKYNVYNTDVCLYSTAYWGNSVDAAYEMIIKLYDLELL